ncbi:MAG: hypothetical protein V7784_15500 [Oceanospirillaceae bacterium]
MPKGFHCGRTQTRLYTTERYRIEASKFKHLLKSKLGRYVISFEKLTDEHRYFEIVDNQRWGRMLLFTFKGNEFPVPLSTDSRSASNKLYLLCPYCARQREHLYAMSYGYACRICAHLYYPSQSEREEDRLMRSIRKLRIKVWGADWPDIYNLLDSSAWWPKPEGMRWATFNRHQSLLLLLEERHLVMMAGLLKIYQPEAKLLQ